MLHPITFSIPEEKICKYETKKTKILSDLIPGDLSTYIYNTENEYYDEYKKSYFAITKKKDGWDCLRHLEIMANGCIPYFINIEKCPKNTLSLYPKDLFYQSNMLYNIFINKNINELTIEDINKYNLLRQKLLDYTKNYLTTEKMAKYILTKTNFENVKNVLYISNDIKPDCLRCLTLHGFKKLFKEYCHDFPKIYHIYENCNITFNGINYGKGFTYSNLIPQNFRDDGFDYNIKFLLINKRYDIIIYGNYHRGMPLYEFISKIYEPNKIILLCGEDEHLCDYDKFLRKGHHVFVREL